jgi:hypothetical protein
MKEAREAAREQAKKQEEKPADNKVEIKIKLENTGSSATRTDAQLKSASAQKPQKEKEQAK